MTNLELYFDINQFYIREAYHLDHRRFQEWLDLLTDDLVYRMPVRITREEKEGPDIVDEMTFFDETKDSLCIRVKRLGTNSAWAESPAPRTRRLVSNVQIDSELANDEIHVCSAFLFLRSRADDVNIEQLFGERRDILRRDSSGWKICSRTIVPDQEVLTVKNLSMFL
jgi:3-phenylpropionate/cinnamic acid dioxygenase small subunit